MRGSGIARGTAALLAAALLGGCGSGAGPKVICDSVNNVLSDFEDPALATIVQSGNPPRNGSWYAYNDGAPGCVQMPAPGDLYVGVVPPTPSPYMGGMALHAVWNGCTMRGAGVGADLNDPLSFDGGTFMGPRAPYDLSAFSGVTFWAMATPGTDGLLRFKMVMRASSRIEDGGACDEAVAGAGKCGDEWGRSFSLPTNGSWEQLTVNFADPAFKQEGWGAVFPWNPRDVVGIQLQTVDVGASYDFWLDDVYLLGVVGPC